MVETVAFGLLTKLMSTALSEGLKTYISDLRNADEHLRKLRTTLQDKLAELEKIRENINTGVRSRSSFPSDWLDQLDQFSYDLEDMMMDIQSSNDSAGQTRTVTKLLQTSIDRVTDMQTKLKPMQGHANGATNSDQLTSQSESLDDELLRVEDRKKIIQVLTSNLSGSGVSIIGIAGIGKTVLAKAIADEDSIKCHFTCICSPPSSPEFDPDIVFAHITAIQSSRDETARVLIQLDDMHSVSSEKWGAFKLRCRTILNLQYKLLITTQNPKVAQVTGTNEYHLHPLSNEGCLSLIHKHADINNNLSDQDRRYINSNEKELCDACKGLPLLAKQIGLILLAAPGNRDNIINDIAARRNSWKLPGLEKILLNLKPVSLLEQNPHLKRCMAYFSLFPRDYEYKKDYLIQLWMAEGFTNFFSTTKDADYIKKVTQQYFDELISCSILIQASQHPPGEEPSYKMNELAYELAEHVASNTFSYKGKPLSPPSPCEVSNITRHFSLGVESPIKDGGEDIPIDHILDDIKKKCHHLRTFMLVHDAGKRIRNPTTFFNSLTRLRVLDLSYTNLTKLESKYISGLKYLRYLNLSYTPVENLPKLFKNPELQVLKLNHCDNLCDLPNDLAILTNLISLEFNIKGLGSMPRNIGKLTSLQRLDVFVVGNEKGFKIAELKNLNRLEKSLCIRQLENVKTKSEAQCIELHEKRMLERLELQWTRVSGENKKKKKRTTSTPALDSKEVLEGLEPHKNLKELTIRNYNGSGFPDWINKDNVCGALKYIHLDRCEVLPSLDQLTYLKTLRVQAMHAMPNVTVKNGVIARVQRFQYIESLVLCEMPELNLWVELAAIHMPSLCNLQVENCVDLVNLPPLDCLKLLQKLHISRCIKLKEFPTLPRSIKSIIIKNSGISQEQVDGLRNGGIEVIIDTTAQHLDRSE